MTAKKTKKNGRMLVPARLTESARSVWLAGVGALAVAEDQGGRLVTDSEKLFGRLVKEGRTYEAKNRKRLATMLDTMKGNVKGVREDVGAAVGKVTGRVGHRVTEPINDAIAAALHRLGVPTRREIQVLTRRVEELTRAVERSGTHRAKAHLETAHVE
jgi:poly(hydroxyalkanoate) granule-associated protein